MRGIILIMLISVAAQAAVDEAMDDPVDKFVTNLIDAFAGRFPTRKLVLKASSAAQTDLDETTLGAAHLAIPRGRAVSVEPWVRHQSLFRGIALSEHGQGHRADARLFGARSQGGSEQRRVVQQWADIRGASEKYEAGADGLDARPSSWSRRNAILRVLGMAGAVGGLQGTRPAAAEQGGSLRNPTPEEFMDLPGTDPPIKYYDFPATYQFQGLIENNPEFAKKGDVVKVKYTLKYRINVVDDEVKTSFTLGAPAGSGGPPIEAFNYGVEGMAVGRVRRLLVPPQYGYGNEEHRYGGPFSSSSVPPGAKLLVDIELKSSRR